MRRTGICYFRPTLSSKPRPRQGQVYREDGFVDSIDAVLAAGFDVWAETT
jgi:hypothetical protein